MRARARAAACARALRPLSTRTVSSTTLPAARTLRHAFAWLRFLRSVWRRWFLWVLLAVLVLALLVTVVWLAGRHEVEQVQTALDRDTADAVSDLRSGLQRNAQSLRASQAGGMDREHWPMEAVGTAARAPRVAAARMARRRAAPAGRRRHALSHAACSTESAAQRATSPTSRWPAPRRASWAAPAYSPSHYVPLRSERLGLEVMELCLPVDGGGYLVATYSLRDTLIELVAPTADARPGGLLHRGRRHPAGGRRRGAPAGHARVHLAAAPRPAGHHPDAARRRLARRARPLSQPADGAGHGDVDRAGVRAGAAGARHAPAPARRARPGRCAGLSQGDGGLGRHRPARARPAGPHHLRQPGVLPDGGLQRRGTAGTMPATAPYWPTELAHEYRRRQAARLAGGAAAARGLRIGLHAQGRHRASRC